MQLFVCFYGAYTHEGYKNASFFSWFTMKMSALLSSVNLRKAPLEGRRRRRVKGEIEMLFSFLCVL
jgi:hypothetical protein